MKLTALPETFAICRLDPGTALPAWLAECAFFSVTRTPEELSIVCVEAAVPKEIKGERGWRGFKVAGPLAFSLTGVLASLAGPLAEAGISLFVVSTYETDYLLVKEVRFEEAGRVLEAAGHQVEVH